MNGCTNYPGCGCAYGDCVIRSDSTNLPETPDGSGDRVIVWPDDHDQFGDPGDEHGANS